MKILVLEDNMARLGAFNQQMEENWHTDTTMTADGAIELLRKDKAIKYNRHYDMIFLDHDLGGQEMVESGDSTGFQVAQFIAEDCPHLKSVPIVVHSWNPAGALNIISELTGHGFTNVIRWAFDPPKLKSMIGALISGDIQHIESDTKHPGKIQLSPGTGPI